MRSIDLETPLVNLLCASTTAIMSMARRPVLYFVGDSLTQDGHEHVRSADTIVRGLSGYTTTWFIEHALPVVVHELSTRVAPSAVTIWFGANDAALRSGWEAYQHVPLETYRQNLAHIVRTLAPLLPLHAKLLLIAPPAVMDSARRAASATGADLDRSNASAGECARACVQVAAAEGVDVLDLHTLLNSAYPIERDRAALFSDGLHFTHAGNAVVAAHVAAAIGAIIENASERERLRAWQFPDFRDLIQS